MSSLLSSPCALRAPPRPRWPRRVRIPVPLRLAIIQARDSSPSMAHTSLLLESPDGLVTRELGPRGVPSKEGHYHRQVYVVAIRPLSPLVVPCLHASMLISPRRATLCFVFSDIALDLSNSPPYTLSAPHSLVPLASSALTPPTSHRLHAFAHLVFPPAVLPSEHAVVAFFDSLPRLGAPSFKSLTQIFVTVPIFTTCHAAAEHLSHVIRNSPKLESIALPGSFIAA